MAPKQTDETKKQAIQMLRDRISSETNDDYYLSDAYLLTWLEDKKFKVDKAEKAFRLSLLWRKNNKIENILNEEFDESWLPTNYEFLGNDKGGRPVILGYSRIAELTEEMCVELMERGLQDKDHSVRYAYFLAEKIGRSIRDAAKASPNTPINSVTVISDMGSVKISEYTKYMKKLLPLAVEGIKTFEDNYPGILHEVIVINAPKKAVRLLLAMMKPFIKADDYNRIHVYGHKPEKWIPILLENVDASVLPRRYGGTKEDDAGTPL